MADEQEYKPIGRFADREIRTFARHVKDNVLDEKEAMEMWLLNEAQIPQLTAELKAAGFIVEPKNDEIKSSDTLSQAVTQSLRVRPHKPDEPAPVTEQG